MWKIKLIDREYRNLKHYLVTNPHHSFRIYTNLGCSLQEMTVHGVEVLGGISNGR